MAAKYPIIDIPNEITRIDDRTPMLLRENFEEIQRALSKLQVYLNDTGIRGGRMNSSLVEVIDEKGRTKFLGDGIRVYDQNGDLKSHYGYYEALADQTAAFVRASTAYLSDGSSVASGVPRYEYMRQPAPVWQDLFDANSLDKYTSGGDTAATWAISGGVLTGTGGVQATLIKKDMLLQDVEIEVNCDQADNGRIIARYQDNNNYYRLRIADDSSVNPNLTIQKVVGGTITDLAYTDVTWPRGFSNLIKLVLKGTLLEAWFNGIKVLSITDTTFSGGAVGLGNSSATAFQALDFKVYTVQRGVMVEEGTTNLVLNPSFETDNAGIPANWTVISGSGASRNTAKKYSGSASLLLSSGSPIWVQSDRFSVLPSAQYVLSGYILDDDTPSPGAYGSILVKWYTAADVWISENTITSNQTSGTYPWTRYSGVFTSPANAVYARIDCRTDAGTIYFDCIQLEQKEKATSFHDSTRAAETLSVPTSGIFNKSNWAVDLVYTPKSKTNAQPYTVKDLWRCNIDSNNYYWLTIGNGGEFVFRCVSGGTTYNVSGSSTEDGKAYRVTAAGDGAKMRLLVNGAQVGNDTTYVDPVGTLPANMFVGHSGAGSQANGLIGDFRISNRARTLAEHQAAYNTGLPLEVDEYTTYLMSCDGHLKPTVRDFGLFTENGRIILRDPKKGQGIELWEGGTQKVLIGRLDDGTIGQIIRGGKLYSSLIRSGAEGATSYIELAPGFQPLLVKENGKYALSIWASGGGMIQFYDTNLNDMRGQILPYNDAYGQGLRIEGRTNVGYGSGVNINGSDVRITSTSDIILDPAASPYNTTVLGDLFVSGTMSSGGVKPARQVTENFGQRNLYARESPDVRYIIEGKGQFINGECRIELDPVFVECIEPNSETTPWFPGNILPLFEPIRDVFVSEIGDTYFLLKEPTGQSNTRFFWSLSAVRKGFAGMWLEEYDQGEDVLISGWEDQIEGVV